MSFTGVKTNKLTGQLGGQNPSTDSHVGFVFGAVAVAGKFNLGETYKVNNIEEVEALGLDAAYDAANKVLVYHHLNEFFRLAPDAVAYLFGCAQPTRISDMVDFNEDYAKKMLLSEVADRNIKAVVAILNPTASYSPVATTSGLDDDTEDAITNAQLLVDTLAAEEIYVDAILLEGRNVVADLNTLVDLRTKAAGNVSVVIGQDAGLAALDAEYAGTAAMGAVAGSFAVRKVNENLGSVDIISKPSSRKGEPDYSLVDVLLGKWLKPALSNGDLVMTLTSTMRNTLTAKGYIYAGSFEGYPGVFLNSSPTCIEVASDYAYIENNRVWNKAARLLRAALIPRVRGVLKIDANDGYLRVTTAKDLENIGKKALDQMIAADEISGAGVYVDREQSPSENTPLVVKANVVKDGILHEIELNLGLTKTA